MTSNGSHEWGRVVVGVDDSPAARAALSLAGHEAAWRGAELHMVSAWSLPDDHSGPESVFPAERALRVEEARRVLEHLAQDVIGAELTVPVVLAVAEPPAARALIEMSERADLVVVGSRHNWWLARLVLGSVSAEVIRRAHCPVVVVPGPRRRGEARHQQVPAQR